MKVRRDFAHSLAFEFTQAMYDKTEPVPHGVNVIWKDTHADWEREPEDIQPMVDFGKKDGTAVLCVGAAIVKDIKTNKTWVFWPQPASEGGSYPAMTGMENMLQEFDEETND